MENLGGYSPAWDGGRPWFALRGKTKGWYTLSVFECLAKLGRERLANLVRPSYLPRIARFQIAKEKT